MGYEGAKLPKTSQRPPAFGNYTSTFSRLMLPAKLRKGQLPTKICLTCGRPFEYRKKWRANWEDVKYCGEKCQRNRPAAPATAAAL